MGVQIISSTASNLRPLQQCTTTTLCVLVCCFASVCLSISRLRRLFSWRQLWWLCRWLASFFSLLSSVAFKPSLETVVRCVCCSKSRWFYSLSLSLSLSLLSSALVTSPPPPPAALCPNRTLSWITSIDCSGCPQPDNYRKSLSFSLCPRVWVTVQCCLTLQLPKNVAPTSHTGYFGFSFFFFSVTSTTGTTAICLTLSTH